MRGALAVRIDDGDTSRHVTRAVKGLRFTKSAPGGHMSASMRLVLPRDTFRDLGPADRVYVYDTRTGATVWEGYTENPGAADGPAGQGFDLAAMGGMVLASDESRALIYVDFSFDGWERATDLPSAASASTDVSTRPSDGLEAIVCQLNPGQPVTTGSRARMWYSPLVDAEQRLGGYLVVIRGGKVDANYVAELTVMEGAAGIATTTSQSLTTTAEVFSAFAGPDFVRRANRLAIQLRRSAGGATNVADDNTWAAFSSLRVAGARVDRFGADVTLTTATEVYAREVVEDLLGRMMPMCDPAAALVEAGTYAINRLAYRDGVKAQQVLDDLALYEPDFLWEILDSTANGHRFNYRAWPTTPRYEISVRDGYEAPGGEVDLCNRVAVFWGDSKGNKRTTVVTSTVPELGTRVRDAEPVTLPEGMGSTANAKRIGEQVLATKAAPPKAARATIRRPIADQQTGVLVMPWEIEPGYIVAVRETGDVLRLTEMEYDDDAGAATLTLGEPTRTLEQLLAGMGGKR